MRQRSLLKQAKQSPSPSSTMNHQITTQQTKINIDSISNGKTMKNFATTNDNNNNNNNNGMFNKFCRFFTQMHRNNKIKIDMTNNNNNNQQKSDNYKQVVKQ